MTKLISRLGYCGCGQPVCLGCFHPFSPQGSGGYQAQLTRSHRPSSGTASSWSAFCYHGYLALGTERGLPRSRQHPSFPPARCISTEGRRMSIPARPLCPSLCPTSPHSLVVPSLGWIASYCEHHESKLYRETLSPAKVLNGGERIMVPPPSLIKP